MYQIADDKKIDTSGVVSYKIMVEGEDMSTICQLESFGIEKGVNMISKATLVLMDGSIPKRDFEISNSESFIPGNKIELLCGYKMLDKKIFEGLIVSQSITYDDEGTRLIITCKSKAYQMTINRRSKIHYEMSDAEIIEEIIGVYGINASVESTKTTYSELVQNSCTDWDFIALRAQQNGLMIFEDGEGIEIKKPSLSEEEVQTLIMNDNLLEAELALNSESQHSGYLAQTWNFSDQEVVEIEGGSSLPKEAGNISSEDLGEIYKNSELQLISNNSIEQSLLQEWTNAKETLHLLAKITGLIKVQGSEIYTPGKMVKISGLGNRFNGVHFISYVHHRYELGNWYSYLQLGLDSKWFTEIFDNVNDMPASGVIPCINGLQIGKITALEGDPSGEHKIQVQLPLLDKDSEGVWARFISTYAGEDYGIQFLPEIGSEVILGFLNDDPNQAIVIGSLYSNTYTAPIPLSDDNFIKIIKTQSQISIKIDDDKKILSIETPSGNIIELNEDKEEISISDAHQNSILMTSDGVTIDSAKDIILKAKGNINIEGMQIESKASSSYKAEGQAGLEIKSSANTVIKGSIVQIN